MTTSTTDQQVELEITGMTCASCANRIERKLNKVDGVAATVDYSTEKAKVTFEGSVTTEQLLATVASAGYSAALPAPPPSAAQPGAVPEPVDTTGALRERLLVCTVLTVPVIVLAMVPSWQFDAWQWLSLTLAAPVVVWGPCPSTGPRGPTCATGPPPWTRS